MLGADLQSGSFQSQEAAEFLWENPVGLRKMTVTLAQRVFDMSSGRLGVSGGQFVSSCQQRGAATGPF
jgi:hypothetical protein